MKLAVIQTIEGLKSVKQPERARNIALKANTWFENEEDFKLEKHDEEDELSTLNNSEIFNKMLVGFMENNGKTEIKFKR